MESLPQYRVATLQKAGRHTRNTEAYDVGICMETLEHIPPDLVEPYSKRLSQVIEGYLFITVPIERGLVFLLKHGAKKVLGMKDDRFDKGEFINSVRQTGQSEAARTQRIR